MNGLFDSIEPSVATMTLRPFQQETVDNTLREFETNQAVLIVMATGLGKTVVLSVIADQFRPKGRIMIVAHREELITQAVNKVKAMTGIDADIEMGETRATMHNVYKEDVVISTIQTHNAGRKQKRMERFDPNEFSLLIVDEAHHATSVSYRKVIDYYKQNPNLKILGVTATPDRNDEKALGQIFTSVACDYGIREGVDDGWLVPISQRSVFVDGLDYSSVRTKMGDLNGKDLSAVLEFEETLHEFADPIVKETGDRKTLIFAVSVAQAERLAEIINRHKPHSAQFVCGKTPREIRRELFKDYSAGKFQYLVNVGITTEGWDEPGVEVVVMARPTKSRCLYTQMTGRGTRPLPDIVDGLETAEERRQAIADSDKPFVEVLDFVGNAGRHKLVSTADILGGKYDDDVIELAKKKAQKKSTPVDMISELEAAEREIRARRKRAEEAVVRDKLKLRAKYSTAKVNPFDVLDISPRRERAWYKDRPPTPKQLNCLHKFGVNTDGLSFTHASQIINESIKRREKGKCSYPQAKLLRKYRYDTDMGFEDAKKTIDAIAANGWRRPA